MAYTDEDYQKYQWQLANDNGTYTGSPSGTVAVQTPSPAPTRTAIGGNITGAYGTKGIVTRELPTSSNVDRVVKIVDEGVAPEQEEAPLTYEQKMGNAQAQMDDLYQQIMNYGSYSYDANNDSLYQFYKDQYINNGQRAMQDTMGQAAGLTGGYGSTYAESAAQQQYNNYLQQLNAIIPELEQNAYSRWSNGLSQLQNMYSMTGDYYNNLYAQQQADYQRLLADLQLKILPSEEDMLNAGFSAEEIAYWQKKLKSSGSGSKKKDDPSKRLADDIAAGYKNGLPLDSSTLDTLIGDNASTNDYSGADPGKVKDYLSSDYKWTYSRK